MRLVLLFAITVTVAGCTYRLHPPRVLVGKAFDSGRLSELTVGASRQQILDAVGTPFEIVSTAPDAEVWHFYQQIQDRGCRVTALGFIPMGDTPIRTLDARIHLAHGVVTRVVVARTK